MLEDFRFKVFVAVAAHKSFTKAAAQLRISQPAVSQHISELEKQLECRLFDRAKGEIKLTDAGRVFHGYSLDILSKYDQIHRVFTRFPDRTVTVAASEDVFTYVADVLLKDFLLIHPEVSFQHVFMQDADLRICMVSDERQRGMIRLSYHPSSAFASTRLWSVLSELLEPTRE